ncbi:MAG: hypothetical protein WC205_02660 [Opitutaceae bacterium]|jgi:hypothetical protein
MRTLHPLLLIVGCALLAEVLCAQSAAPAQPDHVTVRLVSFDGIISDLSLPTLQGRKRFVAMPTSLGREMDARVVDGGVNLFRFHPPATTPPPSTLNTPATPAVPEQPVARFPIQPGVTRYLVIVGASQQGAERTYQVYATPDEPGSLPPGYARVINFTETALAVRLGEGTQVVGASQSTVMQCSSTAVQMELKLARPSGSDGWDLMTSTSVAIPDGRRLLLLIAPQRPRQQVTGGVVIAASAAFNLKILFDSPAPVTATLSKL